MPSPQLEALISAVVMRLPAELMAWMLGPETVVDGRPLERRSQFLLYLMQQAGRKGFGEMSVDETRAMMDASSNGLGPGARYMASVVDRSIVGPGGEIPVRIYTPRSAPRALPALVYYHGGGWVVGSIASHDDVCRALADLADCVVISVGYRLAPEHRFPAAVEDAVAAFRWTVAEAGALGVNPARVAVGGDSAGGNLAAVVAQETKGDASAPCFQLLIYPATDATGDSESYRLFADGFLLTRPGMRWFYDLYLPEPIDRSDPKASPLQADDVSGLAPALVATAGFDPLRDEGRAYADKLAAAGVAVSYRCYEETIHGCMSLAGVLPGGRRMLEDAVGALRQAFAAL